MGNYVTFVPREKSAVAKLNLFQGHFQIDKALDIITFLRTKLQQTTGLLTTIYQEHN
jgi:flagellin-specific chaperone FliS